MTTDGLVKKLKAVPWRAVFFCCAFAFASASILSAILSYVFFPRDGMDARSTTGSEVEFNVPGQLASFSQKQLDAILERNIFDAEKEGEAKPNEEEKPPEADEDDAVRSTLAVKLVGTIYGGDPYSGIALVENTSKRTINSFMVGDVLAQGAKVIEILRERIIVLNAGRREYIEVDRKELARSRRTKKKAPAAVSTGIAPVATTPPPSNFKEEGFERKGMDSVMNETYLQKLLTVDFTKVLQDAKATPNMVDGELRGFQLTRIRQDSIYEKAGLQNDDIVEEVNGVPLTDTAQAIKLLQSLRNEKEIEVRLKRGGSSVTMTLTIQ